MLGRGSARITFAVGVLLTFPASPTWPRSTGWRSSTGGRRRRRCWSIGFCLMQQMLLELPLIGYAVAPEWTQDAVVRFRAWLGRNGASSAVDRRR